MQGVIAATWRDVTPFLAVGQDGADGSWSGSFPGGDEAWATHANAAPDGKISVFHTTDGGRSWSRKDVDIQGFLAQIQSLAGGSTGYILVHSGVAAGSEAIVVLKTADGGGSWTVVADARGQTTDTSRIFGGLKNGFSFADGKRGWLTGQWAGDSIRLYRTHDGGRAWSEQALAVPHGLDAGGGAAQSRPAVFADATHGSLPVMFSGSPAALVLYRTSNGGETWTAGTPLSLAAKEQRVDPAFLDADHVFAVDDAHLGGRVEGPFASHLRVAIARMGRNDG